MEELRSSGYYPDGGCLHAARLAAKEAGSWVVRTGWKGIRGPICPQFSSKKIHNITTLPGKHARAEGQLDNGAFKLSEALESPGRRFLAIPWMHANGRSSQRQELCAPKVPGREDICRCQLV